MDATGMPGAATPRPPTSDASGVLAGRVLNSYDRNPPPTFIRVEMANSNNGSGAAPLEVASDNQGFFAIRGLQPGQHYRLTARTREGGVKQAGVIWATPPNPRLLIYISEDLYTQNTPAAPPPPEIPGQKPAIRPGQPAPAFPNDSTKENNSGASDGNRDPAKPSSTNSIPPQGSVEIGAPIKIEGDPDRQRGDVRNQDVTGGPQYANVPPVANVPGPSSEGALGGAAAVLPAVPTRVPSCVLTGRQLDNFALRDLNGQPWEYKTYKGQHPRGLVLLDFWGTWCLPCRAAISHLHILQQNYGRYGLQVIGIAYEYDAPFSEQVRKVQAVRDTWGINYQLLMGSDMLHCPVKSQFEVRNFPTLVLLDQNSRIIWRCDDGVTPEKLQDLELLIQQQLRLR
jgi:thiol-disulfide isomerase/thioredoxin